MSPDPPPSELATAAILLAAGRSTRMAARGGTRKPFLELAGRSVIERALEAFARCALVRAIVIVGRADDLALLGELGRRGAARAKLAAVVAGGAERTDSVRCGVEAAPAECALVAIHDAARPLVRTETIERCIRAAAASGAALVAVRASDTVKESDDGERSARTLDRARLWLAQTPQVFRRAPYRELLARAARDGFRPTDDAALHERYSGPVTLVEGERSNLKLTTPEDLVIAEAILRARGEREASE